MLRKLIYPISAAALGLLAAGTGYLYYKRHVALCEGDHKKAPLVVCVTGAAGQIGNSLIPLIASGQTFGLKQEIELRLLDIPIMKDNLRGLSMEIEDCAYPLVTSVKYGDNARELLKDLDIGIFLGGFPRKEGMERKELLLKNGTIYREHGKILNEVAKPDAKILVVANPANTNALILSMNAPKIPKKNITCLTRLDHNRFMSQLAMKSGKSVEDVKNVIIWGNHSSTQYPDCNHATIEGKPAKEVIVDKEFLDKTVIETVQKRGAAIIQARKLSSALSAANAIKDHFKSWMNGTPENEFVSMGIITDGAHYEIEKDLCYSMPVKCKNFDYEVVGGLKIDEFSQKKMKDTENELKLEKVDALALLIQLEVHSEGFPYN